MQWSYSEELQWRQNDACSLLTRPPMAKRGSLCGLNSFVSHRNSASSSLNCRAPFCIPAAAQQYTNTEHPSVSFPISCSQSPDYY